MHVLVIKLSKYKIGFPNVSNITHLGKFKAFREPKQ